MKIMLSQPMRGKTEEQIKEEREKYIKIFKRNGDEVIDTVLDLESKPDGQNTPLHYLAESIRLLAGVDAVAFFPGWEKARGCVIEHQCAVEYGKYIKYLE